MSVALRPYPEYRPSGLPWLGPVSARWEIRRNGRLFAHRNEIGFPDLPILEVSLRTGVQVRSFGDGQRKQIMADRAKYKRAARGDIAYNMMRLWQGAVGLAPVDGLVSPAYVVARPYADTDSRYYAYLFRTAAYMSEVNKYSHGIVKDRNRLYWDEFKQMPSPYPSLEEQQQIAGFLDAHGRSVAHYIRNKQRLIALLNEQKQAIIDRAVTRGVDVHMQVETPRDTWVADAPRHWTVYRLKQIAAFNPSKAEVSVSDLDSEHAVFLPMERVSTSGSIDCTDLRPIRAVWDGYTYFRRGDVIIAKITPCFENGKGAYLDHLATEFGFGTTELIVLRATAAVMPLFLYYLTYATSFRRRGEEHMTGAAGQKRVPVDFVMNYPVALPPLDEQRRIIAFIGATTTQLDMAIKRAHDQIGLMREYRTRFIADVVTGKLDVRHVAPEELPVMVDGMATPDDVAEGLAGDEVGEVDELDGVEEGAAG